MRGRRFLGVAAALSLAGAPASAGVSLKIGVEQFSLPNGLRVVVNEDHSLPLVVIDETFDVGSRDERKGQFGFAHLFEHLMFEGSADAPKGFYDRYVNGSGGDDNAWTSEDFTNYFVILPSSFLEGAMWLEADRVRALAVTQEALQNQIKVVEEEFRFRVYNEPYAKANLDLYDAAYKGSPYGHPTLGSFEDLDAASLAEVKAFHEGFYGPQNMVLVVSGDVTADRVKELVTKYFGTILRRETPSRPDLAVPAHGAVHMDVADPLAKVPDWTALYRIPPSHAQDHYALEVLGAILSEGDSSRLSRLLIDGKRIASSVSAAPDGKRGVDMFDVDVRLLDGHTPEEARAAVDGEIARIARDGVGAQELERAQNQLESGLVERLHSRVERATLFGTYAVNLGDPMLVLTEPERWREVTAADVQRVAAKYLVPGNRTDAFVTPGK